MTAGVFTSFLVWQLRPTRDCGKKALAVTSNEERLRVAGITRRDLV
jgi:hypothetical protein